jgi:hypothetical protein
MYPSSGSSNLDTTPRVAISQTSSSIVYAGSVGTVTVASTTGIKVGQWLQIVDGGNTEYVQVISVPGGTTFTAFFAYTHGNQFGGAVSYTILGSVGELNTAGDGVLTAAIAVAAGNTIVKATAGRICTAVITTISTTTDATIYDNATTNTGTKLGIIPGTTSNANALLGTIFRFNIPAANGIVVANTANGPAFTLSFV